MYYSWIPDREPLFCSSIHRLDKVGNWESGAAISQTADQEKIPGSGIQTLGQNLRRKYLIETETTELSEIMARAKLIYPMALEWRNWQTQQTQNLRVLTN